MTTAFFKTATARAVLCTGLSIAPGVVLAQDDSKHCDPEINHTNNGTVIIDVSHCGNDTRVIVSGAEDVSKVVPVPYNENLQVTSATNEEPASTDEEPDSADAEPDSANEAEVVESEADKKAFEPHNAVVEVGIVQLNQLSPFLYRLPDHAKAMLLVAPRDTRSIFSREKGTAEKDIADISEIDDSHGIHYKGVFLNGMKELGNYDVIEKNGYEEEWAKQVSLAWRKANKSEEPVITGLSIGTMEIVAGLNRDRRPMNAINNLNSKSGDFNEMLKQQGSDPLPNWPSTEGSNYQATISNAGNTTMHAAILQKGNPRFAVGFYNDGFVNSRPIALEILPP